MKKYLLIWLYCAILPMRSWSTEGTTHFTIHDGTSGTSHPLKEYKDIPPLTAFEQTSLSQQMRLDLPQTRENSYYLFTLHPTPNQLLDLPSFITTHVYPLNLLAAKRAKVSPLTPEFIDQALSHYPTGFGILQITRIERAWEEPQFVLTGLALFHPFTVWAQEFSWDSAKEMPSETSTHVTQWLKTNFSRASFITSESYRVGRREVFCDRQVFSPLGEVGIILSLGKGARLLFCLEIFAKQAGYQGVIIASTSSAATFYKKFEYHPIYPSALHRNKIKGKGKRNSIIRRMPYHSRYLTEMAIPQDDEVSTMLAKRFPPSL
jgi:hypothetical protein